MLADQTPNNEVVLACDLSAIAPAEREPHEQRGRELFAAVVEVQELPDGYTFRLPVEMLRSAAEWIANERLCCPFFIFTLKVAAQSAALWAALTGNEDVKAFIPVEFGGVLSENVAQAAGLG